MMISRRALMGGIALSGAGALLPRRRTYRALERGVAGPAARTHIFFLTQRQRERQTGESSTTDNNRLLRHAAAPPRIQRQCYI